MITPDHGLNLGCGTHALATFINLLHRRLRPRGATVGRCRSVALSRDRRSRTVGSRGSRCRSHASKVQPTYGLRGLALLAGGKRAEEVIGQLTAADPDRSHRQLGVIDSDGTGAAFTGVGCEPWAGHLVGARFAAQGNMLIAEGVLAVMADAFAASKQPLAETLLTCLDAAQAAGGDKRGQQSAALLVVEADAGYEHMTDVLVDLRVDDHERPLDELRRIYAIHKQVFGTTPREEWTPVDAALASELSRRLLALGVSDPIEVALPRWANLENLENRVDGVAAVDPIVIARLRELSRLQT